LTVGMIVLFLFCKKLMIPSGTPVSSISVGSGKNCYGCVGKINTL
jgi:hypothetical protein